jgi:squalene cyclase
MTSRELKRLIYYPEFTSNTRINEIIDFITQGVFPKGLNTRQRTRYNAKLALRKASLLETITKNFITMQMPILIKKL